MMTSVKLPKLTFEDWVEKGLELVLQEGNTHLCIDKITKLMGLTKGAFYYHFSDKAEFERAILDHYIAMSLQRLTNELSLLTPPQLRLRESLKKPIEKKHKRLSMIFRAWGLENPSVAEALSKLDQLRLKHANDLFRDLGFPPQEAAVRAQVLITFLQSESWLFYQLSPQQRLEQLEERFRFFAEIDNQEKQTSFYFG